MKTLYRKLSINGTSIGHNVISYGNFRIFNRENFRNDVASQSWDHIYCSTNPNVICGYNGKGCFSESWTKMPPPPHLRTMRVRARSSPWITSELKKRMHDRDILKIKAIVSARNLIPIVCSPRWFFSYSRLLV